MRNTIGHIILGFIVAGVAVCGMIHPWSLILLPLFVGITREVDQYVNADHYELKILDRLRDTAEVAVLSTIALVIYFLLRN